MWSSGLGPPGLLLPHERKLPLQRYESYEGWRETERVSKCWNEMNVIREEEGVKWRKIKGNIYWVGMNVMRERERDGGKRRKEEVLDEKHRLVSHKSISEVQHWCLMICSQRRRLSQKLQQVDKYEKKHTSTLLCLVPNLSFYCKWTKMFFIR